ncbi:hypothetical protein RJ55_02723 [Drechmeria coniospora]|nr:hypothetical protein RJ55_02723 [Drechmeria coniospora]
MAIFAPRLHLTAQPLPPHPGGYRRERGNKTQPRRSNRTVPSSGQNGRLAIGRIHSAHHEWPSLLYRPFAHLDMF